MSTKNDELLDEVIGKLSAAALQIIPSDDQIIADHVRDSVAMLLRFKHNRRVALAVARKAILEEAERVARIHSSSAANDIRFLSTQEQNND